MISNDQMIVEVINEHKLAGEEAKEDWHYYVNAVILLHII